jgi:hypothetical protein
MATVVPKFTKDEEGNFTGVETDSEGRLVRTQQLTGFTLEDRFIAGTEENPDGEWVKTWEPHDLGQFDTAEELYTAAGAWREEVVGNYSIGA